MINKTLTTPINSAKKVGDSTHPVQTFTKADYKSKRSLAAQFKVSQELVEKTLKTMQQKRVKFIINGHPSLVVVDNNNKTPRVHPMALDVFEQYLNEQKAK